MCQSPAKDSPACHLLPRWFLAELIFVPWKWRRYVPRRRRLTLNGLHGLISQKMMLFENYLLKNVANLLNTLLYSLELISLGARWQTGRKETRDKKRILRKTPATGLQQPSVCSTYHIPSDTALMAGPWYIPWPQFKMRVNIQGWCLKCGQNRGGTAVSLPLARNVCVVLPSATPADLKWVSQRYFP
jgi:hypothetical protein